MSEITEEVRLVLQGQSPDYFIFPNASAFIAVGLDPGEVAVTLQEMEEAGEIEREQIQVAGEKTGQNGTAETIGGGYRLIRA
jgi:hypothetical protein